MPAETEAILTAPVRRENVPFKMNIPDPVPAEEPVALPPEPLTAEEQELEDRKQGVLESMGWIKPKPKAVVAEPPPAAPPAAPAAQPPAPPAVPPAPPAAPTETPEEREERIIGRTVQRTVEAVTPFIAKPQEPIAEPAKANAIELDPEDAKDLEAIAWLETQQPDKFGGKAKEYQDFYEKHYAYRAKWQKENPGKAYNSEDEDHAEFFNANMPEGAEPAVLDDARDNMRVEKLVEQRLGPVLQQQAAEKALEQARPVIAKACKGAAVKLMEQVAPELAKIATKGGEADFSETTLKALEEADPVAYEVLNGMAGRLNAVVVELEKTAVQGLNYRLDPNIPVHAHILNEMAECEQILADAPAAAQMRDGKQFITIGEKRAIRAQIQQGGGTPAQKAAREQTLLGNRWSLSLDDVQEAIVDKMAKEAQRDLKRIDSLAEKKAKKNTPAPVAQAKPQPATPPPTPAPAAVRPRPPSTSSRSDAVPAPGAAGGPPKSFGETAAANYFR